MRISDWSSDVCSSDLKYLAVHRHPGLRQTGCTLDIGQAVIFWQKVDVFLLPQHCDQIILGRDQLTPVGDAGLTGQARKVLRRQIGRASWRERVCRSV